jgi:hypothetical protein
MLGLVLAMMVSPLSLVLGHYRLNPRLETLPRDCSHLGEEVVNINKPQSGVYLVDPDGRGAFDVFCRFRKGKGYTIFQRRMNGEENFNRTWTEYALGFGDLDGEHWLGLERVHRLTQNAFRCNLSELHVTLRGFTGETFMATYHYFKVLGENQNYRVFTSGYKGNAGDSFIKDKGNRWTSNEMQFTTCDKDNDKDQKHNCALRYGGGWWYNKCYYANLNGLYDDNSNSTDWLGILWSPANGKLSFEWSEMAIYTEE